MAEPQVKPELDSLQVLLLLKLLFTGEEPKLSEMRPELKPARRDYLRDAGLIEYEKRGRAQHVILTDRAWLWATQNLDADFYMTVNGARALAGLLPKLKAYMDRSGVTLAELLAPVDEEREWTPDKVKSRIREGYRALASGQSNVGVRLAELRQHLSEIPRELQDRVFMQMQEEGTLALYHNDNPLELNTEDHAASLNIHGAKRHLVYME